MSEVRPPRSLFTAEEYLLRERVAEVRSDFVNGEVMAMAGGTEAHEEICGNVFSALKQQLRQRPCRIFGSNFKVRIDKANSFRYPDLSGQCGPLLYHDKTKDAYCNPSLIVEVLSPSTAAYDRGEKFTLYRLLDSLFEYVLIRQDRMEVEVFCRSSDGAWTSIVYNEPTDVLHLQTLDCRVSLAEIYEKVEFSP